MYQPDYWKIIKIEYNGDTIYKLLGHWVGGYANGDTWRLNSGITSINFNKETNQYEVHGYSGSVYFCKATNEHISGYMQSILDGFKYKAQSDNKFASIEFVDIEEYQNDK